MSWITPSVIITMVSGVIVVTTFIVITRNNQKWTGKLFTQEIENIKGTYSEKIKNNEEKLSALVKKMERSEKGVEVLKLNQLKLLESDQARKQFVDKEIFNNEINSASDEIGKLVDSNVRLYRDMEWLKKEHAVSSNTLAHITDSIEELIGMVRKIQEK